MKRPHRKCRKDKEVINALEYDEEQIQIIEDEILEVQPKVITNKIPTIKPTKGIRTNMPPMKKSKSIFDPNSSGYNWLKNKIPDIMIDPIADLCTVWYNKNTTKLTKDTEMVFQFIEADNKKNDKLRRQIKLEKVVGEDKAVQLMETVQHALNELYPTHEIRRPPRLLISLPGCGMQSPHMDFDETEVEEEVQLPIFVGLMNSHIDIQTNKEIFNKTSTRINYDKGDMVIMHGNLFHRGCSYKDMNMRVYFYAQSVNMLKDNNTDGYDSFAKPDVKFRTRGNYQKEVKKQNFFSFRSFVRGGGELHKVHIL